MCCASLVVQVCVNEKICGPGARFTAPMLKENVPMKDGSRQLGGSAILRFFLGLIALAALAATFAPFAPVALVVLVALVALAGLGKGLP